jgi:DNA topoisomerase-1
VTTYLVDKLALRAGGEKDDDLADTVGVCTLRVGHVTRLPPSTLKFDFLVRPARSVHVPLPLTPPSSRPQGKDSIRYLQEHQVMPEVYEAIGTFAKGAPLPALHAVRLCADRLRLRTDKKGDENLFDSIDPSKVNKHLQALMPGLTIKVFRTYNASITLSRLLNDTDPLLDVAGKKAQVRAPRLRPARISRLTPRLPSSTTRPTRRWLSSATTKRV